MVRAKVNYRPQPLWWWAGVVYWGGGMGLRYYTKQVTTSHIRAVCNQDSGCDLNPLPGSISYSLSKLEQETKDFVTLGVYEYILQKIVAPLIQSIYVKAAVVGLITAAQWIYWAFSFSKRVALTCCRPAQPEPQFCLEILLEFMGDSRADTQEAATLKKGLPCVWYTKGRLEAEDNVEINTPLQRV